jgi:hypothetical protein
MRRNPLFAPALAFVLGLGLSLLSAYMGWS